MTGLEQNLAEQVLAQKALAQDPDDRHLRLWLGDLTAEEILIRKEEAK